MHKNSEIQHCAGKGYIFFSNIFICVYLHLHIYVCIQIYIYTYIIIFKYKYSGVLLSKLSSASWQHSSQFLRLGGSDSSKESSSKERSFKVLIYIHT
jgi:hypothetical protein